MRTSDIVVGETCASLLLQTRDGAPITIEGNLTVPGAPGRSSDDVVLIFERGTARFSNDRLELQGVMPETMTFDFAESYQTSFDATIAHFIGALRSGAPFETDIPDNLETLRLVEDAYCVPGGNRVRLTPNVLRPKRSPSDRFSRPAMREANGSG